MNLFFDTSALVKFFHEEEGTQAVTTLITPENNIWISELVRIEFTSALFRRFRNNDINDTQLNDAITGFKEEISFFNIEPLGHVIIKEAESLLGKYGKIQGLRTLDALHLGSFNLIAENDWFFVAADENLCKVTQLMGFQSINPLKFHDK